MKKIILFAILLVALVAGSVADAGSNAKSLSVLRHSPKSVEKAKPAITGNLELDCIDSNCLYLPIMVQPGIGSWVKYSEPVLEPGPSGDWDDATVDCPEVLFDGTQYRMWYSGNRENSFAQIGYATSMDGINWEKNHDNPVLEIGEPGNWDDRYIIEPVVLTDGSTWKMWYEGVNEITGSHQIGYATSQDGLSWVKFEGNPVLMLGPSGSWDDQGIGGPYVVLKQGEYHMWYHVDEILGIFRSIGYATSTDGINWTKFSGNPVLGPPSWWGSIYLGLGSPSGVEIFGAYNIWSQYSIIDHWGWRESSIIHRTSPDGINWVAGGASLPQDMPFGDFCPSVITHNNLVKMWYRSMGKIFYAEAPLIP